MIKTNTSQFKAKLGRFMKAARAGQQVIVTDRDTPVARLVAFTAQKKGETLDIEQPHPTAPRVGDIAVKGIKRRAIDSLALLQEDRRRR